MFIRPNSKEYAETAKAIELRVFCCQKILTTISSGRKKDAFRAKRKRFSNLLTLRIKNRKPLLRSRVSDLNRDYSQMSSVVWVFWKILFVVFITNSF